jgi:hypothetical protein
MQHLAIHHGLTLLALALPLAAPSARALDAGAPAEAMAQAASPQAIAEYHRKLQQYTEARAAFEAEATSYWGQIVEKRRGRNAKRRDHVAIALDDYVLTQPPLYTGPKRPVNPEPSELPEPPRRPHKHIPVVADLLHAAAEHFQWVPQRPASEAEFKRAYARFALGAGLTREQAVRVYAFETGGVGHSDVQSGIEGGGKHAISTAIGYNQLLTTNTVELIAEQGHEFLRILTDRAARLSGPARSAMDRKLAVLKKMVALARSVPDDWSQHEKIGDTPQGWALHAMVLDVDVGPMLQTHKLLTSVIFARAKGYTRPLTAAELEMMNLTGDGTGLDMVTMPQAMREQVPTSNFFQRSGYERNPVAIRHNTVAKLLAITDNRMDANSNQPGAREMSAAFGAVAQIAGGGQSN